MAWKVSKECRGCRKIFEATSGASRFCSDSCHLTTNVKKVRGCWIWQAGFDKDGYGMVRMTGRRRLRAHRASYAEFVGPVASGVMVCHTCDEPACINPGHLFLGTAQDNKADSMSKARHVKGEGVYWKAKLRERDVIAIRADNRRAIVIASEYGIDRNSVHHIKARKTWKHIA
jgi:hypothetical protein